MLNEFINLLKKESDYNSERKFYVRGVMDDRLQITVFEQVGISAVGRFLYEDMGTVEITDQTIENFITGYYDIPFDEWYIKNYLRRK